MINGLNHVTLSVSNVLCSFNFYKDILGFKPLALWEKGAYFLLKDGTWFCLNFDSNKSSEVSVEDSHIAFSVTMEDFNHLSEHIISSGHSLWSENKSEGESLYFLDPDGNKLELHVGDWQSRLNFLKKSKHKDLKFFEEPPK